MYLKKAGTFIALASLTVWFLSSFPRADIIKEYSYKIRHAQGIEKIELKKEVIGFL